MRLKSIAVGGAMLAGVAAASAAPAPATPDEAAAIRAALERYVGHGDGGTSPVTVTPEADHYKIAIDLKAALHAMEALGFQMEPASYAFTAAATGAGLWHVGDLVMPKLTIKHADQNYSVVLNGANFDGLFDPRVPGFQSSNFSYDSMSVAGLGPRSDTQTQTIDHGRQTTMATPTGNGVADLQISQSSDGFAQDVDAATVGVPGQPKGTFSLRSTSTSGSLSAEDLHTRALVDLWAFFVAHSDDTAFKAAQEDLRAILRRALPLFDRWVQSGETRGITVESPYGTFGADAVGGRVKLSGLVADGFVESEVHVAGLSIPPGLVPDWAGGLVPTSASVGEVFSGFHLDAAARQAVDSFDLTSKDPLKPEVLDSMKTSVGPLDHMVVALAPSRLVSRLLSVDFDGEVRLSKAMPDFHVNIRASGLDAAMQELQVKGAGDPTAGQAAAVLVLAKGLGKAEPDGKLSWVVTRDATGNVTVNGLTLPGSPHN